MRYRFSKDEISICGGYGDLTLSIILDGEYKSCSYLGYSTQEAIRKFQQDFGTYPKNYIPVGTLPINNFGGIAVMEIENGIEDYVYVTDNFVWTPAMDKMAENIKSVSKTLNGRVESPLADKLLAEK